MPDEYPGQAGRWIRWASVVLPIGAAYSAIS